MNCPLCSTGMQRYDKHGIEIDVCPGCRGVWLDRGELEKLLETEARYASVAPGGQGHEGYGHGESREHSEHRGSHGYEHNGHHGHDKHEGYPSKHGRRRSLLGEIFGGFGGDDD